MLRYKLVDFDYKEKINIMLIMFYFELLIFFMEDFNLELIWVRENV